MDIRLATMEDFDIFNEMYTQVFVNDKMSFKAQPMSKERYTSILELEGLYFAVEEGKKIGFAILYAFEDVGAKIELFYVKEKNKGYGKEFYYLLEKEIRDSNIHRVFIHILFNEPERFWRRMGFISVNGTEEFEKILK